MATLEKLQTAEKSRFWASVRGFDENRVPAERLTRLKRFVGNGSLGSKRCSGSGWSMVRCSPKPFEQITILRKKICYLDMDSR